MAKSRYFLDRDPVRDLWFIIPEMYQEHWDKWKTRIPESTTAEQPVYARRLDATTDVTFEEPKFIIYGDERCARGKKYV